MQAVHSSPPESRPRGPRMRTDTGFRVVLALVLLVAGVGVVGALGFYLGKETVENRAARELNAMMRLQERLYRHHRANGLFPPPGSDAYRSPDLAVSDHSDTSVSYYSGVARSRVLTLHIRGDGTLLTSRR